MDLLWSFFTHTVSATIGSVIAIQLYKRTLIKKAQEARPFRWKCQETNCQYGVEGTEMDWVDGRITLHKQMHAQEGPGWVG